MMDERREGQRRQSDLEGIMDVHILRAEVLALRQRQDADEAKIAAMEAQLSRLTTQLSGAKGVLWGAAVVASGLVYLIGDRLKELLVK